jgi:signal transduction histidine kinase
VPLVLRNGEYFGTLCALDPDPSKLTEEAFTIFQLIGNLISYELDAEQMRSAQEALFQESERREKLREELTGVLGHDLRSPLNTIRMASEVLLMQSSLPQMEETLVKKIVNSVSRMNRMIGDLLDLTRTRLGQGIPVNPEPSDLALICRELIVEAGIHHPLRTINLAIQGDCQAEIDPDRAIQAISNLINNALQYSPENSEVDVSIRGEAHKVVLQVTNQGNTIPAETLAKIFVPFERGSQSNRSSSPTASLGLGLYITSEILLAHNGSIGVDSTDAKGTTFSTCWKRQFSVI